MIVRYQELFIGIAAEFYWYWYCILLVVRLILLMIVRCQELFIRHHQEYICQAFFWTKQRMALMGIFIGGWTNVMYIDATRRDSPSFN